VKVTLYRKKYVIEAEEDEMLSLTDVGNGEIYIQRIKVPKSKEK